MGIQLLSQGNLTNEIIARSQIETLNQRSILANLRFDQAINASPSSTYTLVANTMSYFPLSLKDVFLRVNDAIVSVSTANATGTFQVGLYDSNIDGTPRNLIWQSIVLNTIVAGAASFSTASFLTAPSTFETRNLNTYLFDGRKNNYWIGFLSLTAAGVVRAVPTAGLQSLGLITPTGTTYATCRQRTGISAFPELNPFTVGSNPLVSANLPSIRLGTTSV
jgi:hypothetical protein